MSAVREMMEQRKASLVKGMTLGELHVALVRATLNNNGPLAQRLAREIERRVGF